MASEYYDRPCPDCREMLLKVPGVSYQIRLAQHRLIAHSQSPAKRPLIAPRERAEEAEAARQAPPAPTIPPDDCERNLRIAEGDIERLRQRQKDLEVELGMKREVAQFEVRRDMLLVMAATLHWTLEHDDCKCQDVEAGLVLALQAGGAEVIGKQGDKVAFSSRSHSGKCNPDEGAQVTLKTPPVIIRSKVDDSDLVLIKGEVECQ